ncbi:hypothetical protein ABMA28_012437 [Loxostege sticticalis]|uniref:Uncharacterized protein n=1 Tax=Loxostege sticticalis TaxID=481309 RepID=A0ABD0S7S0_LOXSC
MTSPVTSPLAASGAPVAGGHAVTVTASVTGHTVTGLKKATAPKERRASQPPPVPARTSVPLTEEQRKAKRRARRSSSPQQPTQR